MSDLISTFVRNAYHIPNDIELRREMIDAEQLVHPDRLDIMAKLLYLEKRETAPEYALSIYLEHIGAMTKGSYIEAGSDKSGKEAFLTSFDALVQDLQEHGYDSASLPIPVDKHLQIMDGAHRVAAALYLHIPVQIVRLPVTAEFDNYGASYFEERGTSEDCIDAMVLRYLHFRTNAICINVWPSAKGHDEELEDIILKEYSIVYKKQVSLNENGAFNYLAQIYHEYSWAQNSEEGFAGVYRKLMPCFPTFDPIRVYFVETEDMEKLVRVKEEMRALFQLEKHSLHATDTQAETLEMGELLLSSNSVFFMNHCESTKYPSTFRLLEEAKGKDNHTTVYTGSIVLALYGIREAEDLDYLCIGEDPKSHNDLIRYYGHSLSEMLSDPRRTFVYFGLRFVTLKGIEEFKKNRNEGKDSDDLKLIALVQSKDKDSGAVKWLRFKRRATARVQGAILKAAHKTGTYDWLRSVYKKVKGKRG